MFKKAILTLMAIFMASSGMPVYAEDAAEPEVTEQKDDAQASAKVESVLGIKKLYAEEPSMLTTGTKFNETIKTLAAGKDTSYNDWDHSIQSVQVVNTMPSGSVTTKDVSANNDGSYLAWWDAGTRTIKLYSKSREVILNPNSFCMFSDCRSLTALDVSGWNTSHVTNMGNMFGNCYSLTSLDVSNWDTSQVTDMNKMFFMHDNRRSSLTTLNVSNWDTSKVTNMGGMFLRCSNLTTLDVSDWDTTHVTDMTSMFGGCNITTLDLSNWNTSQVTDMSYMFDGCSSIKTIYIGPGWNTDNVTKSSNMFRGCSKLPHFHSSIVDKTNANAGPLGYMSKKPLHYLPDTVFVLSGTSDYGTPINMVVTSNKSGRMSFKNIEKGTYTLTEVSPTDGYVKNSVKYTVTVTDSGVSVTPDNADYYYETADQKVLFNEPYHAFTIQKASSTDSTIGVAGAEFLLSGVSDYGTEVSQTQTTGSTGIATFDHLEAGNYLLTETKAPEHYALDPIARVVSINKYGTVKIDGLQKEGSSFVWTDIRNADGTVTITKKWNDTLTGTNAASRTLPSIVISTQRTIPDAVTITYNAGEGYFGTDQNNKTNLVTYSESVDQNGNILSVTASKGEEKTPSASGKTFDAWYLDSALTNKMQDSIVDYIKKNSNIQPINLYAKYKDASTLKTGVAFNEAIKTLAAGGSKDYYNKDTLIRSVQVVNTRPSDGVTTKDVSANKDRSYLAWWDAETSTIKLYSESGDVILNPHSYYMFFNCDNLATLDVSNWDTSYVTDMNNMFYGCSKLTTLDVSNWDTSKVTSMYYMFCNCDSLTTLNASNWDTSKVTDMGWMFFDCSSLTALDLSNWNTSQVTSMSNMFKGCSSLTTLNVSKWDTSQVTSMSQMFYRCSALTTIYIGSKWNTDSVTSSDNMFYKCTNLPHFNSNVVDKTNAHAGTGGYMTLK